jgi:hypothetical protein
LSVAFDFGFELDCVGRALPLADSIRVPTDKIFSA